MIWGDRSHWSQLPEWLRYRCGLIITRIHCYAPTPSAALAELLCWPNFPLQRGHPIAVTVRLDGRPERWTQVVDCGPVASFSR